MLKFHVRSYPILVTHDRILILKLVNTLLKQEATGGSTIVVGTEHTQSFWRDKKQYIVGVAISTQIINYTLRSIVISALRIISLVGNSVFRNDFSEVESTITIILHIPQPFPRVFHVTEYIEKNFI